MNDNFPLILLQQLVAKLVHIRPLDWSPVSSVRRVTISLSRDKVVASNAALTQPLLEKVPIAHCTVEVIACLTTALCLNS